MINSNDSLVFMKWPREKTLNDMSENECKESKKEEANGHEYQLYRFGLK